MKLCTGKLEHLKMKSFRAKNFEESVVYYDSRNIMFPET